MTATTYINTHNSTISDDQTMNSSISRSRLNNRDRDSNRKLSGGIDVKT